MSRYQYFKKLYEEAREAVMFVGEAMLSAQQRKLPIAELNIADIRECQDILDKCSEIYILKDGSRRCVKKRYGTQTLPDY
jgi:hypothetical protein